MEEKKEKQKVLGTIAFVIKILFAIAFFIMMIWSFTVAPVLEATKEDILIFRISFCSFFLPFFLAMLWELNAFHVKDKAHYEKRKKMLTEVLIWMATVVIATVLQAEIQNLMSEDYKQRYGEYLLEITTTDNVTENVTNTMGEN